MYTLSLPYRGITIDSVEPWFANARTAVHKWRKEKEVDMAFNEAFKELHGADLYYIDGARQVVFKTESDAVEFLLRWS